VIGIIRRKREAVTGGWRKLLGKDEEYATYEVIIGILGGEIQLGGTRFRGEDNVRMELKVGWVYVLDLSYSRKGKVAGRCEDAYDATGSIEVGE
jgi:hypothetical protein